MSRTARHAGCKQEASVRGGKGGVEQLVPLLFNGSSTRQEAQIDSEARMRNVIRVLRISSDRWKAHNTEQLVLRARSTLHALHCSACFMRSAAQAPHVLYLS